jgi:hypothetical protein
MSIHIEAGCTPDGYCWPSFDLGRPAIIRELTHEEINRAYPGDWRVMAFALIDMGHVCQVIMPKELTEEQIEDGWTLKELKAHELSHCAGFTHKRDETPTTQAAKETNQ